MALSSAAEIGSQAWYVRILRPFLVVPVCTTLIMRSCLYELLRGTVENVIKQEKKLLNYYKRAVIVVVIKLLFTSADSSANTFNEG